MTIICSSDENRRYVNRPDPKHTSSNNVSFNTLDSILATLSLGKACNLTCVFCSKNLDNVCLCSILKVSIKVSIPFFPYLVFQ